MNSQYKHVSVKRRLACLLFLISAGVLSGCEEIEVVDVETEASSLPAASLSVNPQSTRAPSDNL